jgi:hypothetical protein
MSTEPNPDDPAAFVPFRERPALDKGPMISWRDLESGMLFRPAAGAPTLRRVRGTPRHLESDRGYLIGSEDEADGCPKGGIIGTDEDRYRREYLPDGRPVYNLDLSIDWARIQHESSREQ